MTGVKYQKFEITKYTEVLYSDINVIVTTNPTDLNLIIESITLTSSKLKTQKIIEVISQRWFNSFFKVAI